MSVSDKLKILFENRAKLHLITQCVIVGLVEVQKSVLEPANEAYVEEIYEIFTLNERNKDVVISSK